MAKQYVIMSASHLKRMETKRKQKLLCKRCGLQILPGQEVHVKKGNDLFRYYHGECWASLFVGDDD